MWTDEDGRRWKQCVDPRRGRWRLRQFHLDRQGWYLEGATPGDDHLHEEDFDDRTVGRRRARVQAERGDGRIELENHRATSFQTRVRTHQAHSIFFHEANHRDHLFVRRSRVYLHRCVEDQVRCVEHELIHLASVLSFRYLSVSLSSELVPKGTVLGSIDLTHQHSTTDKHFEHSPLPLVHFTSLIQSAQWV